MLCRMRSATMRHAICTVSGLTSQVTCLARTLWWKMRRWTTELLKECGWATTSALPCSRYTRSSCARWYVSAIPATSTTFCLSCVLRIFLTALNSLLTSSARCTRRMATRFNVCRSVRARAFVLQLRGSQSLSLLTLVRQMPIRGRILGSSMRGSQMRRSRIKNRHLLHSTRCS